MILFLTGLRGPDRVAVGGVGRKRTEGYWKTGEGVREDSRDTETKDGVQCKRETRGSVHGTSVWSRRDDFDSETRDKWILVSVLTKNKKYNLSEMKNLIKIKMSF